MSSWRSREDGSHYPVNEGESQLDEAIDRVLRADPNVCQYCKSGGVSTTAFPTTGLRACESCFIREFQNLSPEEQEAVLTAAEAMDTLVEAPSAPVPTLNAPTSKSSFTRK